MPDFLNQVPTPWMTFTPQSATPALPASGNVVLFLDGTDKLLYELASDGTLTPLTAALAGHGIASGNAGSDFVRNANGQLLLSGGG